MTRLMTTAAFLAGFVGSAGPSIAMPTHGNTRAAPAAALVHWTAMAADDTDPFFRRIRCEWVNGVWVC
jgi:hypothetical protein